jgi:hypothetical protein
MRTRFAFGASIVGAALLASAVPASADAALTAHRIRVGDHAAFVRVVVDFSGGRVLAGEVVATDPDPFGDGVVRLPLTHRGVRTTAAPVAAHGVSARVSRRSGRIVIRLAGAPRRFKYARVSSLQSPGRLVVDLYKSAPPSAAATILVAPDRCLSLGRATVSGRRVRAAGGEGELFEHSLVVRVRRRGGRILGQRPVTAAAGRWSTSFRVPGAGRQAGTLEAVALSAKDGTLDCLVQLRVRLGG